ncbi:hypothetical protein ACQP1V_33760 [Microtetraspora malaysiensis]|uniref:hypothetical protein n=1 Tax=Microtetraspora malaysiensis TaxID=161358 RepID=UPI003D8C9A5D
MFTIRMNEAAASALQPLAPADPPSAVPVVGQGLRDKFAQGLTYNEGALTFADHVGRWAAQPSVSAAIAEMGWQDLTGYEGNVNAFHLEDYAPVHVAILSRAVTAFVATRTHDSDEAVEQAWVNAYLRLDVALDLH